MLKAKIGVALVTLVLAVGVAMAADAPAPAPAAPAGGGFAGPGGGGRGGNFDPAAMRQQMMQRLKETLGATDQEWTVIEPKLGKVIDLSAQLQPARQGGMGGGRGRGGAAPAPAAPAAPVNDVEKARAALQTTLDDTGAAPEVIKAKLAALRDAKEKVRQELDKATTDLKSVLSVRQEALLVMGGRFE